MKNNTRNKKSTKIKNNTKHIHTLAGTCSMVALLALLLACANQNTSSAPRVFSLINTDNVTDNNTLELDGAYHMEVAIIENQAYLFAVGQQDHGISVFRINSEGTLTNTHNVPDTQSLALQGSNSVISAVVGDNTFVFVASNIDDGVSVFRLNSDGTLTNTDNVFDADNTNLQLDRAYNSVPHKIANTTYLFVVGEVDDGVSVFRVDSDGTLANVYNVTDNDDLYLNGAYNATTTTLGIASYLFVAGQNDNGISVFRINTDGSLVNVYNVLDDGELELELVNSLKTIELGGATYLFAASEVDDGISVFRVNTNGTLTNTFNISDEDDSDNLKIDSINSLFPISVNNSTYLFTAAKQEDAISVFRVGNNGSLTSMYSVIDNNVLELDGTEIVLAQRIGDYTYLFASGNFDNGISVFRIQTP